MTLQKHIESIIFFNVVFKLSQLLSFSHKGPANHFGSHNNPIAPRFHSNEVHPVRFTDITCGEKRVLDQWKIVIGRYWERGTCCGASLYERWKNTCASLFQRWTQCLLSLPLCKSEAKITTIQAHLGPKSVTILIKCWNRILSHTLKIS